jgi:hypothetical protein
VADTAAIEPPAANAATAAPAITFCFTLRRTFVILLPFPKDRGPYALNGT